MLTSCVLCNAVVSFYLIIMQKKIVCFTWTPIDKDIVIHSLSCSCIADAAQVEPAAEAPIEIGVQAYTLCVVHTSLLASHKIVNPVLSLAACRVCVILHAERRNAG